jgi:RNA-binding protein
MKLSSKQIRFLREQAHHLNAIARVGDGGVSESFLKELDKLLTHHELIKIKLSAGDKATKKDVVDNICQQTHSVCVQTIGHTTVIFRKNPQAPKIEIPKC